MELKGKKIGVAVTGSFCTFEKMFRELEVLTEQGAEVYPIFSKASQETDSRFGRAEDFLQKAARITGKDPVVTVAQAEPIGPKACLDLLVILPCTGNTAAKLTGGITDTPVLMAAKAHLRNNRPLLIFLSTNDGLGMNMKNIGLLMNTKHIYFVPFGQDDPVKKPNSLVSHCHRLLPAMEAALEHRQLQPVLEAWK